MKEDNRKKIPLPPEVYDQFIALKSDEETTTDLVKRCIEILSPQDQEMKNEHSIQISVDIDDYEWMRQAMKMSLPKPSDGAYISGGGITMLVDDRALSPVDHNTPRDDLYTVRPVRDVHGAELKPKDGQTWEELYASIIEERTR